ncbi:acyltransferase family protein [Paraflavitalea pollutisoli]|uniref:acyltransferase family protein n=1 Tax=Paraflavitalea pollutisoli TaxID=3034143 RepID=UPI0023ED9AF1|nr:acyltransferase [Paraflavitalea sp. H1-2-19X]
MSNERFTYIDGLRGIAIAGVIITHAASITHIDGISNYLASIGGMGVQLFFVISAFTIFYTLSKTDGQPFQFRDFYIRRLFRIIPIYWLGIILYTLVYGMESRGWREGPELWHYPYHILLVNTFHPLTSSSVVPGGWSISCEVMFYMLVPVLYKYFNTNKKILVLMLIALFVLPVGNYLLNKYASTHWLAGYEKSVTNNFFYRWIPSQLACFGFGMILYRIWRKGTYQHIISKRSTNLMLVGVVSLLLLVVKKFSVPLPQTHHVYALLFMILALLLSAYPWKLYVNKFTVFLGKISYSGYLIHFLVIKQVTLAMEQYTPQLTTGPLYFPIVTLAGFAFTIPLAYISYKYLELSSVSWGKALIKRLSRSRELAVN